MFFLYGTGGRERRPRYWVGYGRGYQITPGDNLEIEVKFMSFKKTSIAVPCSTDRNLEPLLTLSGPFSLSKALQLSPDLPPS